jgi:protein tyrosine phosphatase (PTP) superfamily phosphohydrolase (DUF442 family)
MKRTISSARVNPLGVLIFVLVVCLLPVQAADQQPRQSQAPSSEFESLLKVDAPIVLCIDDKPSPTGQPSDQAYGKAAASGFRAVLTLRSRSDGVDLLRERFMVEKTQLRYFNLPVLAPLPKPSQVEEFLGILRDKRNQPMLINCAIAERVAPYMMIFNLVERGWTEERAVEEAVKSGLRRDALQELARSYLKARATSRARQKIAR